MSMSEDRPTLDPSAELVNRPPASGWSSAGGVPDSEPRNAHSSGTNPSHHLSTDEFLRRNDLERRLLALERKTAGRKPTRDEHRLAQHYRRQLRSLQGDQPP